MSIQTRRTGRRQLHQSVPCLLCMETALLGRTVMGEWTDIERAVRYCKSKLKWKYIRLRLKTKLILMFTNWLQSKVAANETKHYKAVYGFHTVNTSPIQEGKRYWQGVEALYKNRLCNLTSMTSNELTSCCREKSLLIVNLKIAEIFRWT